VRFFYNGSDNMPGALFTHLSCLSGLGLSRKVVGWWKCWARSFNDDT
jgi:hypothetical protein